MAYTKKNAAELPVILGSTRDRTSFSKCSKVDVGKVGDEFINDIRDAQLKEKEWRQLLQVLGVDPQDANRLTSLFKPFNSDDFIEYLFQSSADGSKQVPAPSLGVIRLDYDYPPAPGDIDHSGSFQYDVYYRIVPGLTFEMCQKGKMTPEVEQNFIDALRYLEGKGVSGITGDCGFMMWFQSLARQHTTKPVFMSSLAHLPTVVTAMGDRELVAVFTANGKSLEPMRNLIKDECNIDMNMQRLVIVGCEDVPGFEAVAEGKKVDTVKVQPGIVEKARQVVRQNPNIRAILMECTELPPYSDALRAALGLPVFDAITCCDFFIRSRLDNPRVGLSKWQAKWDESQEQYKFGQNLAEDELDEVVNREALGNARLAAHRRSTHVMLDVPEYLKRETPTLGVIRLDNDDLPAIGEVAHPNSFAYPVIYRCVPGLTRGMCLQGQMSPEVELQWQKAVKYLDDRNVAGITCECSLSFWFQDRSREYTKRPVLLSPIVQVPAILSAFARHEKVLIVTESEDDLRKMMVLMRQEFDIDSEDQRLIVMGVMNVRGFEPYSLGAKHTMDEVAPRIAKRIQDMVQDEQGVCAILLEGATLSPFSDWVKAVCHLPVFDALSCCDLFLNGSMDNPLFGMDGWQKSWDGQSEGYRLGQHLTKADKKKMIHNVAQCEV